MRPSLTDIIRPLLRPAARLASRTSRSRMDYSAVESMVQDLPGNITYRGTLTFEGRLLPLVLVQTEEQARHDQTRIGGMEGTACDGRMLYTATGHVKDDGIYCELESGEEGSRAITLNGERQFPRTFTGVARLYLEGAAEGIQGGFHLTEEGHSNTP